MFSSHVNPEGDAIGAILALGLALEGMAKEAVVLNQDPIPEMLNFLPGAERIIHQAPETGVDIVFALDCGDRERLGEEFAKVKRVGKIINIDHHVSNNFFGDINYVDPQASSASEIIYELLQAIPMKMTVAIAENIYTGILTDTGSFHYSNTSPQTFSVARACLLAGVDPWKVADKVYETQPLARLRLLSQVLQTLTVEEEGRVSYVVVTQAMLEKAGAAAAHTEDMVNFPRSLENAEVAILFRELSPEKYRVSLRSRGKADVTQVAQAFQGGGHRSASGCTVAGNFAEVKAKVLERVRASL
ncbi:MAG: bifunctional oligoribonuclease/PAP phosphatase NrnA [Deltaproteobacteria bacterium]|nr:bifunctional oligoribonuclease/PAP phosphatase NrnA [Deltaproteobacteria bacterium]